MMIHVIRRRAAADGRPLDHVTDAEISRKGIGVEYIMPELIADMEQTIAKLTASVEELRSARNQVLQETAKLLGTNPISQQVGPARSGHSRPDPS
jgi:hypothetical protein